MGTNLRSDSGNSSSSSLTTTLLRGGRGRNGARNGRSTCFMTLRTRRRTALLVVLGLTWALYLYFFAPPSSSSFYSGMVSSSSSQEDGKSSSTIPMFSSTYKVAGGGGVTTEDQKDSSSSSFFGNWFPSTSSKPKGKDWSDKKNQDRVRAMFKHSWNGYKQYAWGDDELKPLSKHGKNWTSPQQSLLFTPIDSLDSLWIMGLMGEYEEAKGLVISKLGDILGKKGETFTDLETGRTIYRVVANHNHFEINIRMLGGLLSAFTLDPDARYLSLSQELGDRLISPLYEVNGTGLPSQYFDLNTGKSLGMAACLASVGTIQLELQYLSDLTGNATYQLKAMEIYGLLEEMRVKGVQQEGGNGSFSNVGLYPNDIVTMGNDRVGEAPKGYFSQPFKYSIGANADSFYEYLLKLYISTGEEKFKEFYERSRDALLENLYNEKNGTYFFGEVEFESAWGRKRREEIEKYVEEQARIEKEGTLEKVFGKAGRKNGRPLSLLNEDLNIDLLGEVETTNSRASRKKNFKVGGKVKEASLQDGDGLFGGRNSNVEVKFNPDQPKKPLKAKVIDARPHHMIPRRLTSSLVQDEKLGEVYKQGKEKLISKALDAIHSLDSTKEVEVTKKKNSKPVFFKKPAPTSITPEGKVYGVVDNSFSHLSCFAGGMFALGSQVLQDPVNGERDFQVGLNVTETCFKSYLVEGTHHLGGESFRVAEDGTVLIANPEYILRPEIIESVFYAWRFTKDPKYREWGVLMMDALDENCKTEAGYSGVTGRMSIIQTDYMESFFLAETLKYLFLLFSDDSVLSLDEYVYNTENHPFSIRGHGVRKDKRKWVDFKF